MNSKHMMLSLACAAAFAGGVQAADSESTGWNYTPGEGISFGEQPIVSAEFSFAIDSKYLSYGLVDNNEPIMTPAASLTLLDWLTFSVESVFDMTTYGRKTDADGEMVYVNRASKYVELDPGVAIGHAFSPEDHEWLPTTVAFELGYMYEYHPRSFNTKEDDTQFINFSLGLPDLWIEPTFSYERDIDRDDGTYVNLELGHTFELCESLSLRPSVAQGLGNTQRVKGYLTKHGSENDEPLNHGGLMDTCVKVDLEWAICDTLTFGAYVAYSDYLFDSKMRESARDYEATGKWDESYNFVGGVSLTATF